MYPCALNVAVHGGLPAQAASRRDLLVNSSIAVVDVSAVERDDIQIAGGH